MRSNLIAAKEIDVYIVQAQMRELYPHLDFDFVNNRFGALDRVSSKRYEMVVVDYDLGGLTFIQELIEKAIGFNDFGIFNLNGHVAIHNVEKLCRRNFSLYVYPTTYEFLETVRKHYRNGA